MTSTSTSRSQPRDHASPHARPRALTRASEVATSEAPSPGARLVDDLLTVHGWSRPREVPGAPARPVVIAVAGKGGDGKSSTTGHLGDALARLTGWRILLVDLDPQRTLSDWLAPGTADHALTVDDVLIGGAALDEALVPAQAYPHGEGGTGGGGGLVAVLPASTGLVDVEADVHLGALAEEVLDPAGRVGFDVVLLDTYASRPLGGAARILAAALACADLVLVPFQPRTNSLDAMRHTLAAVRTHEAAAGRSVDVALLPNRVARSSEGEASVGALRAVGWEPLPAVRESVAVSKAQARRGFLRVEAPSEARVAGDYDSAAEAIARRILLARGGTR